MVCIGSRVSSVSIVSRLRAGLSGVRILTQTMDYPSSPNKSRPSPSPFQQSTQTVQGFSSPVNSVAGA